MHAQAAPRMVAMPFGKVGTVASGEWTRSAVDAAFDRARILDWAERVRAADEPVPPLVARPGPDARNPSYPSAVEAYREIIDLVSVL
jgi:hypothetical protein